MGSLPQNGHKIRAVSYGTDNSWVILYDRAENCHGGIPMELAGVLDDAASNNVPIRCVGFSGRDWICLADDIWWTSNTNLPASQFIDRSFKAGKHPRWIAFVPNDGPLDGDYHMEFTKSHRAAFTETWNYHFPNYVSKRWFIALALPTDDGMEPGRGMSPAALLTSDGWKAFHTVYEEGPEKRPMLVIDYPHDDPLLKSGFKVQTTLISHDL